MTVYLCSKSIAHHIPMHFLEFNGIIFLDFIEVFQIPHIPTLIIDSYYIIIICYHCQLMNNICNEVLCIKIMKLKQLTSHAGQNMQFNRTIYVSQKSILMAQYKIRQLYLYRYLQAAFLLNVPALSGVRT